MFTLPTTPAASMVRRIVISQWLCTCGLGILALTWSVDTAISVFLGGLTASVANTCTAYLLLVADSSADQANKLLLTTAFTKWTVTLASLALCISFTQPAALILGFIITQFMHWIVPLFVNKQ